MGSDRWLYISHYVQSLAWNGGCVVYFVTSNRLCLQYSMTNSEFRSSIIISHWFNIKKNQRYRCATGNRSIKLIKSLHVFSLWKSWFPTGMRKHLCNISITRTRFICLWTISIRVRERTQFLTGIMELILTFFHNHTSLPFSQFPHVCIVGSSSKGQRSHCQQCQSRPLS